LQNSLEIVVVEEAHFDCPFAFAITEEDF
jgi:hypothetical protein